MFGDQYKKDMQHVALDDNFIAQLKCDIKDSTVKNTKNHNNANKKSRTFQIHKLSFPCTAACIIIAMLLIFINPNEIKNDTKNMTESLPDYTGNATLQNETSDQIDCDGTDSLVIDSITEKEMLEEDSFPSKEFIKTDPSTLKKQITIFTQFERGTKFVQLDYAYGGRIIFHDYYGLGVYDYEKGELTRLFDLAERTKPYVMDGEDAILLHVMNYGTQVLIKIPYNSETFYYQYDIQNDQISQINDTEYNTSINDSSNEDTVCASTETNQSKNFRLSPNEECYLCYKDMDDPTIASLSLCINIYDDDHNLLSKSYHPVFSLTE